MKGLIGRMKVKDRTMPNMIKANMLC